MNHHSPEHEVLLAELLGAADAAAPPEIAACPECQKALADARQMAAHVAGAARQEQELLAAAERMDPAAAAQAARRFAAEHLSGRPSARPRRPWGWWSGLLLAAAAGVAVLLWPPGTPPEDSAAQRTGPVRLGPGNEIRLDHPVGPVASYAPFSWQAVDGAGIVYELSIYEAAADGRRTLIRTLTLETTTWDPEAARLVLPDRIQWHVRATSSAHLQARQAWASASLSPR